MPRQTRVARAPSPRNSEVPIGRALISASLPASHRSKLSANVNYDVAERLRNLAYSHRLSASSIVEIALASIFARGDDESLGDMLRKLGATRRSK